MACISNYRGESTDFEGPWHIISILRVLVSVLTWLAQRSESSLVNTLRHAATTCEADIVSSCSNIDEISSITYLKLQFLIFAIVDLIVDDLAQIRTYACRTSSPSGKGPLRVFGQ